MVLNCWFLVSVLLYLILTFLQYTWCFTSCFVFLFLQKDMTNTFTFPFLLSSFPPFGLCSLSPFPALLSPHPPLTNIRPVWSPSLKTSSFHWAFKSITVVAMVIYLETITIATLFPTAREEVAQGGLRWRRTKYTDRHTHPSVVIYEYSKGDMRCIHQLKMILNFSCLNE